MDNRRRAVAGVGAVEHRIAHHRGQQRVVPCGPDLADGIVHDVLPDVRAAMCVLRRIWAVAAFADKDAVQLRDDVGRADPGAQTAGTGIA